MEAGIDEELTDYLEEELEQHLEDELHSHTLPRPATGPGPFLAGAALTVEDETDAGRRLHASVRTWHRVRTVERDRERGTRGDGGPNPPTVGSVYQADTLVFNNGDHASSRPVVVVRAPRRRLDYVTFLQRSSTCFHLPGVDHPADPALGLDRKGRWVFAYQRSVRSDEFDDYQFEHRGDLEPEYLALLLEAWEGQP